MAADPRPRPGGPARAGRRPGGARRQARAAGGAAGGVHGGRGAVARVRVGLATFPTPVRASVAAQRGRGRAMSESQVWDAVDAYFTEHLSPDDEVTAAALRESEAAGLPPIGVTANQGKLLQLLAQVQGARGILEIGTLGGYSTIWLARALPPEGRLISLEYSPATPRSPSATSRGPAWTARSRCGWVRRWSRCPGSPTRTPALRPGLHRRRQGQQPALRRVGAAADPRGQPDRPGQRGPGRAGRRRRQHRRGRARHPGGHRTHRFPPAVERDGDQTVGGKGYDGFALARVLG